MNQLRQEFLFIYDIQENKKRKKIFERAQDFGLKPIQRSVLWGELSRAEVKGLWRETENILNKKETSDKVILMKSRLQKKYDSLYIGHEVNEFEEKSNEIF
jgi:CRISPR-associated endonuclease Cas2